MKTTSKKIDIYSRDAVDMVMNLMEKADHSTVISNLNCNSDSYEQICFSCGERSVFCYCDNSKT